MEIPTDMEPCPSCDTTSDVKVIPDTAPNVQAWKCGACGTDWAVTVINPRSYLDHLVATVELAGARFALRALLSLADDAPGLTDAELRSRLMILAGRAGKKSR
jgi:ribosomal protein L37AE/L43A